MGRLGAGARRAARSQLRGSARAVSEPEAAQPSLALGGVTHLSSPANTIYLSSVLHLAMVMTALVILAVTTLMSGTAARVSMIQSRACYYQRHNRELVCQCREDNTHLHLKLREFINARQEVRSSDP